MFHNILVSYDGSADSRRALDQAVDLAQAENARLTVLTAVWTVPYAGLSTWGPGAASIGDVEEKLAHEAETTAREAAARVPSDLAVTALVAYDPIGPALMEQIDQAGHDLLVMGSRGRGPIRSALLGSTSHYALDHSPIPVLIVHEASNDRDAMRTNGSWLSGEAAP